MKTEDVMLVMRTKQDAGSTDNSIILYIPLQFTVLAETLVHSVVLFAYADIVHYSQYYITHFVKLRLSLTVLIINIGAKLKEVYEHITR